MGYSLCMMTGFFKWSHFSNFMGCFEPFFLHRTNVHDLQNIIKHVFFFNFNF